MEWKILMGDGHVMWTARLKLIMGEEVRYISHLDLQRAFQRALRRAEIDVAYSQGFNPHPKTSFAMALAVGMTSEGEYIDVELNTKIQPEELMTRLNNSLPQGLQVVQCKLRDKPHPSLMSQIDKAIYTIEILTQGKNNYLDIQLLIEFFMQQDEIIVERVNKKGKKSSKNIRPFIDFIQLEEVQDQLIILKTRLATGSKNNVKPENMIEKLIAFGGKKINYEGLKIHRIDLLTQEGKKLISPIENF